MSQEKHYMGVVTLPRRVLRLQAGVARQLQLIARHEREVPIRAILTGLALHAIKAALPHGKFGEWQRQMLPEGKLYAEGTLRKNASYYMRLAVVAIDRSGYRGAGAGDARAIASALARPSATDRPLIKALTCFVAGRSLNELLIAYGIKRGERRMPRLRIVGDAEQRFRAAHREIAGLITRAENLFVRGGQLRELAREPEKMRAVVVALRKIAESAERTMEEAERVKLQHPSTKLQRRTERGMSVREPQSMAGAREALAAG